MPNLIDQVGSSIQSFSWAGMGQILNVILIFFIIIIVFVVIFLFMWWKSFNIKVRIYEPLGQVKLSDEKIKEMREHPELLKNNEIKFNSIKFKTTHGKNISLKGVNYFSTFMPLRKHDSVPMEYMYDDGIHMLRISRELFIPIPKPQTIVEIDRNISISIADDNKWRVWNNMLADRINNKYQDIDAQKKVAMYFIVGIVALVLVGGFLLWLIYSTTNKNIDSFKKLGDAISTLSSSSPK